MKPLRLVLNCVALAALMVPMLLGAPATTQAKKPAFKPVVAKWSMRELPRDEVNLIVFGDFVNGKDQQKMVARTLANYVDSVGTQFNGVLTVGDNFYVKLSGVDDYQFQSLFEDMYDAKRINFPFFLAMGNHDYEPSQPDRSKGEKYKAEIEMEYARKNPHSRLKYPAKWYRVDFPQNNDRPMVTALLLESDKPHLTPQMWEEEKRWIDQQLSSTTAPWTIACAHHPLFSNGAHGDNGVMQVEWGPIFKEHGLDFYCGGHDHDLQHLQIPGWSTSFIQAGGGGQPVTDMRWDSRGPFSRKVHGFVHLRLTPERAEVKYVDGKSGKIVHHFIRDREGDVRVVYTTGRDRATTKPLKTLLGIPESASK